MLNEATAADGARDLRILVMSHSHPLVTRGGAEICAHAIYDAVQTLRGATAWFLGCSSQRHNARLGVNLTQPFGANDYVYHPNAPFDYFKFANPDREFPDALAELIADLRPDIVHSHHYVQLGVEAFSIIKRAHPRTKIVVSLHEYLAICHNHGQMVRPGTYRLCYKANAADCLKCFPNVGARDFFLRKRYIQTFFEDVDLFIAPSQFLADRYIAWGLPSEKLTVLENMPPEPKQQIIAARRDKPAGMPDTFGSADAPTGLAERRRTVRLGFFGQMSPLKGIIVLIEAAKKLAEAEVENVLIDIHGDYSNQPLDFQQAVIKALDEAGTCVSYRGPYDNAQVHGLMQTVDAVVVPSTWWENSPVVIQEAFTNGKPVICSDIGGMAEKVRDGIDGFHFQAGSASSLATLLENLAREPDRLTAVSATVRRPLSAEAAVDAHIALYRSLLSAA